jgi:hypothetical protein
MRYKESALETKHFHPLLTRLHELFYSSYFGKVVQNYMRRACEELLIIENFGVSHRLYTLDKSIEVVSRLEDLLDEGNIDFLNDRMSLVLKVKTLKEEIMGMGIQWKPRFIDS